MPATEPRTKLWTREEYYRLGSEGYFMEQRVELIGGEIIEMSPQKNLHSVSLELVFMVLHKAFGKGHWVRHQLPMSLSNDSEPEPDIAVVKGTPRQFKAHPSTALLVVEVSDSTLAFDRSKKASLYASAGIQDYWILNLIERQLEVHGTPVRDPAQPFEWRYRDLKVLKPEDRVSPLALPKAKIRVAELLP